MNENNTFRVSDRVLARQAGGETVLLDLRSEEYFGLDGVGSRFWQLVAEGATFGAAVDALLGEYEVPRGVLARDLDDLVRSLLERGLVTVDEA